MQAIRRPIAVDYFHIVPNSNKPIPDWAVGHVQVAGRAHERFVVRLPHAIEVLTPDVFRRDYCPRGTRQLVEIED